MDGGLLLVLVLVLLRRRRWLLQQHRLLEVLGLSVDLLEFLHQHLPAKGELRRQGVGPRPSPGITLWAGRVISQKAQHGKKACMCPPQRRTPKERETRTHVYHQRGQQWQRVLRRGLCCGCASRCLLHVW